LDEEKSKYAGLAQEIGFRSAKLESLQWLVEGEEATLCTCKEEECNKYDLSAPECFFLSAHHIIDWFKWFAILIVPPHLFAIRVSVLWVGLL
jgi:hypothetical protein